MKSERNGITILNICIVLFISLICFNAKDIRLTQIVGGSGWICIAFYEFYVWCKVNEDKI
jgi:hypothetical protein